MWRTVVGFAVAPLYLAALLLHGIGLLVGLLATGIFSVGCMLFQLCDWMYQPEGEE